MRYFYFISFLLFMLSCSERYSPKPRGYIRVDLAPKKDKLFAPQNCPFNFTTSNYFELIYKNTCWIDLEYAKHNATIHMTYKKIDNDLFKLLEDSRNMVYKHTVKADAISEKIYHNNLNQTHGTLYDIEGETASSVQFHITDSISNFIRGALYFQVNINKDSLSPIINYLRDDILKIMESLRWENETFLKE